MSFSHEDWLLLILADGQWHSLAEILRRQPMMAHSRAAGLREKGYEVEHKTTGRGAPGSWYRLTGLGSPGSKGAETADVLAAPGDPSPLTEGENPQACEPVAAVMLRADSAASPSVSDTRPRVSSSPLSGGPGATLAAVANPALPPLNALPAAQAHQRAGSQPVGASRPRPSLGNDNGRNQAGSALSGASAQAGWEGHGRPASTGCELDDPSSSPPAQLPLPGVAA